MSDIKTLFLQLLSEENKIIFVPDGEGHSHTFKHGDNEYKVHMLPHPKRETERERENDWEVTFLRKDKEGNWTDKPSEKPGRLRVWREALAAVVAFPKYMPNTKKMYIQPPPSSDKIRYKRYNERLRPMYLRHLPNASEPPWAGKFNAKVPINIKV